MKNNPPSKTQPFKRLLFINVNKYQQQILIPVLMMCLLACVGVFYALYYVHYINENVAVVCQMDLVRLTKDVPWFIQMHSFNKVVPWILFSMATVLFAISCWLFYVSNKILGPSSRVLEELDDILSGQRKEPIGTRPGDEFFKELLKRINSLIQKTR